jgi:hypothetical protein
MKLLIICLLVSVQSFAQSYIQKKDGTKIPVVEGSVKVQPINNRLVYSFGGRDFKIKYKDLDNAVFSGFLFRSFTVKNKARGYFVLAESTTKTLAAVGVPRTRQAGGFEINFVRYEINVFNTDGTLAESMTFTNEKNDKNMLLRADAAALIKSHFSACENLIQRLEAFEITNTEQQNDGVAKFVDSKVYTSCK